MFIQTLFKSPIQFLTICVILVFSICLHEYCHAWMAYREGDSSASEYMTLNPLRQMGFMSLLMMAIIGIAWGAVPVDVSRFRGRWSRLKVALAGPAANLFMFLLAALIFILVGLVRPSGLNHISGPVMVIVYLFGMYNFTLMVFNLLPVPGLDGWIAASELFPRLKTISSEFAKGAMLFLILLAFFGVQYLFAASAWVMQMMVLLGAHLGGA
ncbi:MAG: site-2 protease family protein [Lentisphaerae bacterium]|nr:site-2 protease family protein [Lentisphaerota bacterium]